MDGSGVNTSRPGLIPYRTVKVGDKVVCWNCDGKGARVEVRILPKMQKYMGVCSECEGTGVVTVEVE